MDVLSFLQSHSAESFAVLFALSELLSFLPNVKANGLFQLVQFWIQSRSKKNG